MKRQNSALRHQPLHELPSVIFSQKFAARPATCWLIAHPWIRRDGGLLFSCFDSWWDLSCHFNFETYNSCLMFFLLEPDLIYCCTCMDLAPSQTWPFDMSRSSSRGHFLATKIHITSFFAASALLSQRMASTIFYLPTQNNSTTSSPTRVLERKCTDHSCHPGKLSAHWLLVIVLRSKSKLVNWRPSLEFPGG